MIARAAAMWFVLMLVAIGNGAFRTVALSPYMGDAAAHLISTVVLCVLILLLAYATITWIAPVTRNAAVLVGAVWCGLTIAFEFLAGHYLFRNPWPRLLADYDITAGRVWILVPLVCAVAPLWAARAKRLLRDQI